jgi:pyruvate dehydrogenase (quinone)
MTATVAEVMVATLKASGVRRVYGLPGDSLNGFTDALRRDGEITWEHVRHEEAAGFAAAAEAALTGELAVCAGSCGPGNLHLINGLFDANRSRVPVLAIAAQIPAEEIGSGYFQETHPDRLFGECSVYCELVSVPEQLPRVLETAMRAALARGGVAVVVVPGEVFLADAPAGPSPHPIRAASPVVRPDEESLAAAAQVLNNAGAVTILAGAGCAGAHDQLIALAAARKAPVVHAFRGKEFVEYDNPYDVGMTGLIGFSSGYRAMEHCDALVMLGTDFPYRPFFPQGVPVVQVDVRGEQIGKRLSVQVPLVGTVKDTADALLPLLKPKTDSAHLDRMTKHYRRARARLDRLAKPGRDGAALHPQHIAATVDKLAAADAVFTADVGTPCIWTARYLHMNGTRRLVGSFNHGSMANALPHAIGAQATYPGRQVIALAGDGGDGPGSDRADYRAHEERGQQRGEREHRAGRALLAEPGDLLAEGEPGSAQHDPAGRQPDRQRERGHDRGECVRERGPEDDQVEDEPDVVGFPDRCDRLVDQAARRPAASGGASQQVPQAAAEVGPAQDGVQGHGGQQDGSDGVGHYDST